MQKIKKDRGITLVALVITIVVLLVLASVVLQQLEDGGILDRSKEAREKSDSAGVDETNKISEYKEAMEIGNDDEIDICGVYYENGDSNNKDLVWIITKDTVTRTSTTDSGTDEEEYKYKLYGNDFYLGNDQYQSETHELIGSYEWYGGTFEKLPNGTKCLHLVEMGLYATGEIIENNDIKISGVFSGGYSRYNSDRAREGTYVIKASFTEGSKTISWQEGEIGESTLEEREYTAYKIIGNQLYIYNTEVNSITHEAVEDVYTMSLLYECDKNNNIIKLKLFDGYVEDNKPSYITLTKE